MTHEELLQHIQQSIGAEHYVKESSDYPGRPLEFYDGEPYRFIRPNYPTVERTGADCVAILEFQSYHDNARELIQLPEGSFCFVHMHGLGGGTPYEPVTRKEVMALFKHQDIG